MRIRVWAPRNSGSKFKSRTSNPASSTGAWPQEESDLNAEGKEDHQEGKESEALASA